MLKHILIKIYILKLYFDKILNDNNDCKHTKSIFICPVKKLYVNYGYLQIAVLVWIFKTYCCKFHGSQM